MEVIVWCAAALTLGGFVKGVMGVGVPMVAVPLMSLFIPAHYAAAMVVLPVIPANLIQLRAGGKLQDKWKRFWPLIIAISVGTVIGGAIAPACSCIDEQRELSRCSRDPPDPNSKRL